MCTVVGPPSFPYTPGGDVCGVVVAVPPEEEHNSSTVPNASNKTSSLFLRSPVNNCNESKCKFRVGDKIATRFVNKPMGALGEYALVSPDVCDCVPDGITPEGAAALVSSGTVAVIIADRIQEGDRVLIFGAGGGVGSHLCQLARLQGASYVAGVAHDAKRLMEKPLNCDYAIDYTKTDPFDDVKEWRENPFDVIVDLSGGVWPRLVEKSTSQSIIKPGNKGGRYITTTPDSPIFEMHSIWAIMSTFMFPSLWRALSSRMRRWSLPKYSYVLALPSTSDIVTRTLKLGSESKLVPVIDTKGPFHFTTDGVREAFRLQQSYHAKGKVVITVAKE